jgi:hypothetical protein
MALPKFLNGLTIISINFCFDLEYWFCRSLLTTDSLLWWRVGSIVWGIQLFSGLSEAPKVGFFVFIENIWFLSIWCDYYCLFCFLARLNWWALNLC